jgi:hypothetical protein
VEITITRKPDSISNNKFQHFALTRNPRCLRKMDCQIYWIQPTNFFHPQKLHGFSVGQKTVESTDQILEELKSIQLNPTQLMPHRKYCRLKRGHKDTIQHHVFNYSERVEIVDFPLENKHTRMQ